MILKYSLTDSKMIKKSNNKVELKSSENSFESASSWWKKNHSVYGWS